MSKCCLFDGTNLYNALSNVLKPTGSDSESPGTGDGDGGGTPITPTYTFGLVTEFPKADLFSTTQYRVLNENEFAASGDLAHLSVEPLVRGHKLIVGNDATLSSLSYLPIAWRIPKSALEGRDSSSRVVSYNGGPATNQYSFYVSDFGTHELITEDDNYWYLNLALSIESNISTELARVAIPGDQYPYDWGVPLSLNLFFINTNDDAELQHLLEVNPKYSHSTSIGEEALTKPPVEFTPSVESAPSWFDDTTDQMGAIRQDGSTLFISNAEPISSSDSTLYTVLRVPLDYTWDYNNSDTIGVYQSIGGSPQAITRWDAYTNGDGYLYVSLALPVKSGPIPYVTDDTGGKLNILGTVYDLVYELTGTPVAITNNPAEPNFLSYYRTGVDMVGTPNVVGNTITVTNGTNLPTQAGALIYTMVQVLYADLADAPAGMSLGFIQDVTYSASGEVTKGASVALTTDNLLEYAVARSGYYMFPISTGIVNAENPYVEGHTDKLINILGSEVYVKFHLIGVGGDATPDADPYFIGVRSGDGINGPIFDVYNIDDDGGLVFEHVHFTATDFYNKVKADAELRSLAELAVKSTASNLTINWETDKFMQGTWEYANAPTNPQVMLNNTGAYLYNTTTLKNLYAPVLALAKAFLLKHADPSLFTRTTATVPNDTLLGIVPLGPSRNTGPLMYALARAKFGRVSISYSSITYASINTVMSSGVLTDAEIAEGLSNLVMGFHAWSNQGTSLVEVTVNSTDHKALFAPEANLGYAELNYVYVLEQYSSRTYTTYVIDGAALRHTLNWLTKIIKIHRGEYA